MKILILHQHFKIPQRGGAIRSYYLAKALVDRGHEVMVLTGHDGPFKKENIEGIDVIWMPIPYHNRFGFMARIVSFLKYIILSFRRIKEFKDVDLCYAISVPITVGWIAIRMKRKIGIPYLFEVGDLWPEAPIQLGFIRHPLLKKYLYRMEIKIYEKAEAIVALSTSIRSAIREKLPNKRVHLIPNIADTHFFHPTVKESMPSNPFIISYVGALGFANGLDFFLSCAQVSQEASLNIQFQLCGEGAMLDDLERKAKMLELNNTTFVSFQNRDGVKKVLDASDAAFVSYKSVPILETGSPNKYFDGLASGKLIIVNFNGWIRNEIEEHQCGIYIDPKDPSSFISQIEPFLHDRDRLQRYQESARLLAVNKYSRDILGEKFVKIIIESQ